MYFKYGSYQHATNEVGFTAAVSGEFSSQKTEWSTTHTWSITGELLQGSMSASEFQTAVGNLVAAYQDHYQDAGLYFDDGTPTVYNVVNTSTVGGVLVTQKPALTSFQGAAYGNFFPYSISLQFILPSTSTWGTIKEWVETVRWHGTGGPHWLMQGSLTGAPEPQQTQLFTPMSAVQSGRAVGTTGYPVPPLPLWSLWEHLDQREMELSSPLVLGPVGGGGAAAIDFAVSWSYFFEAPLAINLVGSPHSRPV
jgi:hypothetical protein